MTSKKNKYVVSPHRKTVRRTAKSRKVSNLGRTAQVLLAAVLMLGTAAYANANLILNPGFQTSTNGTTPDSWQQGGWGANDRAFEYADDAGNRSGKVTMTTHTDGDAKWYFDSVNVDPSMQYVFSDAYKSTAPTKVTLQFTLQDNSLVYLDLAETLPAAADWTSYVKTFSTPANVKSLTGFHLLPGVGELSVDNFSLELVSAVTITDFVPNNSFEQAMPMDANLPAAWSREGYGANTALFEYANEGHQGTRSAKVTVSNYVSGDAKWAYDAQPLTPGSDYRFSAWYKTNTTPRAVVRFLSTAGAVSFYGMPNPENNDGQWHLYNGEFSVPANAASVTVYFYVSSNGYVQTDDYHVTPFALNGFDRPLVSLTFDDGAEQNTTTILPTLDGYGFKTTQCYATQFVEGIAFQEANLQSFVTSGHEICSHTVTHPFLSQIPAGTPGGNVPGTVDYELAHALGYLKAESGQAVKNFASPYGDYSATVINQIKDLYSAHRTVNEGYNTPENLDLYRLRVQNMRTTTTLEEFQGWVTKAKQDKTWLILVYHKVDTANLGEFDTQKADFDAQMAWLAGQGVTVKTMQAAIEEVTGTITPTPTPTPSPTPTPVPTPTPTPVPVPTPTPTPTPVPTPTPTPTPPSGGGGGGSNGPRIGVISGMVFNDANSNSAKDASEAGVAGQTVYLDNNNNGVKNNNDRSTVTAADGSYSFTGLAMNTYNVRLVLTGDQQLVVPGTAAKGARKAKLSVRATMAVSQDFGVKAGTVLGTETPASCQPLITQNLYTGVRNDEVRKLQEFLARHLGRIIPATGYYGTMTKAGVSAFQLKYSSEILAPHGLSQPTGNVYALTRNKINSLNCGI